MNVNTGSYYDKKSGNVGDRRVAAGKKGIFAETFTLTAGATVTRDFSEIKMNGVDGVTTGFIYCKGPTILHLMLILSGWTYSSRKARNQIKGWRAVDLGQFNGRIYEMQMTNTNGGATTDYTLVGE